MLPERPNPDTRTMTTTPQPQPQPQSPGPRAWAQPRPVRRPPVSAGLVVGRIAIIGVAPFPAVALALMFARSGASAVVAVIAMCIGFGFLAANTHSADRRVAYGVAYSVAATVWTAVITYAAVWAFLIMFFDGEIA